jgi:CBS domain-containing protein
MVAGRFHGSPAAYVVDLIRRVPIFVPHDTTGAAALSRAREADVHYLVVVRDMKVTGVCCRCTLASAGTKDLVGEIMASPAVVIDDQTSASTAADMMLQKGVGCLPIVDWAEHLRGVVTRSDLLKAGALATEDIPACSSCGAIHGVLGGNQCAVKFCFDCLEQSRAPRRSGDESYFTLGGGD